MNCNSACTFHLNSFDKINSFTNIRENSNFASDLFVHVSNKSRDDLLHALSVSKESRSHSSLNAEWEWTTHIYVNCVWFDMDSQVSCVSWIMEGLDWIVGVHTIIFRMEMMCSFHSPFSRSCSQLNDSWSILWTCTPHHIPIFHVFYTISLL